MNDQQMIEKSNDKIEPDYLDDDPSSDIDLTEATQTIAKVSIFVFINYIRDFIFLAEKWTGGNSRKIK